MSQGQGRDSIITAYCSLLRLVAAYCGVVRRNTACYRILLLIATFTLLRLIGLIAAYSGSSYIIAAYCGLLRSFRAHRERGCVRGVQCARDAARGRPGARCGGAGPPGREGKGERGGGRGCGVAGCGGRRGAAGRGPDSGDLLRPIAAYCGLLRLVAGCCGLSSAGAAPGRAVSESAESRPARRSGPPGDSAMRRRREWEGAGEPAAGGESGPGGVRVHGAAVLI